MTVLVSLIAKEYGYTGREIAKLIKKDPAIVTRHLRKKGKLKKEIEEVVKTMRRKEKYVNSQACTHNLHADPITCTRRSV